MGVAKRKLADVQSRRDHRRIEIDKVGVKDIRYPISVLDKENGTQSTVATINMYVSLPHGFKGAHMSRFVEILDAWRGAFHIRSFPRILVEMRKKLKADTAHLEVSFPYFIKKKAPVTGSEGLVEYGCTILGVANHGVDLGVEVTVPITTLCPCSKEIAEAGAHNQRGEVKVRVRFKKFIWIEDLIDEIEQSASCEVYSLLKRPDEKYVTEKAYRNPMFVEDVVREIAKRLDRDENIVWFSVGSETLESIHKHNAYAYIVRDKEGNAHRQTLGAAAGGAMGVRP